MISPQEGIEHRVLSGERVEYRMRRRRTPSRDLIAEMIVARPADGTALLFNSTACQLWKALVGWRTQTDLNAVLAEAFPGIPLTLRSAAVDEFVALLDSEDLLDRQLP